MGVQRRVDALAAYTTHCPHVVLMDIGMPRMDGLAATRQIRRLHPSARIVIVTDYDDDGLRYAAKEAGACYYALKENLPDLPRAITWVTTTSIERNMG